MTPYFKAPFTATAIFCLMLALIAGLPGQGADFGFGGDDSFGADNSFDTAQETSFVTITTVMNRDHGRPGDTIRLAVVLDIHEGWYSYANPKGPGTGAATVVTGQSQAGFSFSPARYLPGKKKAADYDPEDWVYAYEGKVPVFMELAIAEDARPGAHELSLDLFIQGCKGSCIQLEKTLPLPITVKAGDTPSAETNKEIFARFDEAKAPAPGTPGEQAGPPKSGTTSTAGAPADGSSVPAVDISLYKARTTESEDISGVFMAIALGFIAGLLLNVMPCVLPLLSIKITSLVNQSHEQPGRIFRLGLAFGAGILSVFLVLAILAATIGLSWGGLFQSATFNIIMIGLVFVFALGLFDIYIINVGGGGTHKVREGYLGSFYKGVLATFLATPCSGPFLGATLAWVLTQQWHIIMLVFTSIGMGMALPYVILSASPKLMRFVPKPGAWMETFKHMMGFVLLGMVIYLFTFLRQELVLYTLTFCLFLGFSAYLFGRFAHTGIPSVKRWVWRAVLSAAVVLAAVYTTTRPVKQETSTLLAQLGKSYQEKRTVVVDFTADWCTVCKVVDKTVLKSEEIQKALKEKNIDLVYADITHATDDSAEIRLRNQLGSKSVPFLAVLPGNDHYNAYVLRDLFSKQDLLDILEKCP